MKKVIYKYHINPGETKIKGWFGRILHVGEQGGELYIWVENILTRMDFHSGEEVPREENEKTELHVFTIGTGWPYFDNESVVHVGTVQMSDGLVWHVFLGERGLGA